MWLVYVYPWPVAWSVSLSLTKVVITVILNCTYTCFSSAMLLIWPSKLKNARSFQRTILPSYIRCWVFSPQSTDWSLNFFVRLTACRQWELFFQVTLQALFGNTLTTMTLGRYLGHWCRGSSQESLLRRYFLRDSSCPYNPRLTWPDTMVFTN